MTWAWSRPAGTTAADPGQYVADPRGRTRNVTVTAAKAGLLTGHPDALALLQALTVSGPGRRRDHHADRRRHRRGLRLRLGLHDATLALGNVRVTTNATTGTLEGDQRTGGQRHRRLPDKLDVTATSSNARLSVLGGASAIAATATGDVTVRAITAGSLAGNLTLGFTSRR
ncbi:hypothetical protein EMGBS10_17050 [Opitutia bacterium]|nr:hypothetical protein EMGBS10_17050 [Opitutae bacterium]